MLLRILSRRRSSSSVGLSIRIDSQWPGCGIDWRRSRGRCTGSLVTSKTVIPLSALDLANLACQGIVSFFLVPNLSNDALPVASVQTVDETRDQMRVFRSFFNGGYVWAELSSLPVLVLVQTVASLILEQLQTQVLERIFVQTSAVVRGVVANEWYTL
jgi:hypothetical protein